MEALFGTGKDLTTLQMSARSFVLFFYALALVRIGGMRAFGRKSSFDTVIVIMLGAVLSRAVVGASPAIATCVASLVFVVVHRLLAMATSQVPLLERVVKGRPRVILKAGALDTDVMHRAGISKSDLDEAVRSHGEGVGIDDVDEIRLETSGDLSVNAQQP